MSVFSNPITRAGDEANAYTRAVLAMLGDRDPFAVLAETPETVAKHVAAMRDEALRRPEAPGKWSAAAVVQHLADSELVWGWRLRLVLAEDRPPIRGYDQDRWAARLRYHEADAAAAREVFTVLRKAHLRLLRALEPADRARVGIHSERGEESVEHMIRMYAGHDLVHLRQIERIGRTVGVA